MKRLNKIEKILEHEDKTLLHEFFLKKKEFYERILVANLTSSQPDVREALLYVEELNALHTLLMATDKQYRRTAERFALNVVQNAVSIFSGDYRLEDISHSVSKELTEEEKKSLIKKIEMLALLNKIEGMLE